MHVYLVKIDDFAEIKIFSSCSGAINWLYNEGFELDDVNELDFGIDFYKEIKVGHCDETETIYAELREIEIEDGFSNSKYQFKKEENQGQFETTCLVCGSNNISTEQEYDYDYEENIYPTGMSYLYCNDCGNENRWL